MKMRQKLAAVLAASMVLTAMPVLTLAKSDFSITTGIQVKEKDKPASTKLKVEMKDATDETFVFFVSLDNSEFTGAQDVLSPDTAITVDPDGYAHAPKVNYIITGDKEMKIIVTPNAVDANGHGNKSKGNFELPINVKLKGGDATIAVDGASSVIGDMSPVVFARTSGADATVKVDDAESIYKEQKTIAKITVEEPYSDSLSFKDDKGNNKKIKFQIKHSDYKFVSDKDGVVKCTVKTEKGFSLQSGKTKTDLIGLLKVDSKDDGVVEFELDENVIKRDSLAAGRLTFEFDVKSTEKKPSTGKLNVKVSGDDIEDKTVTVGEVKDYGTIIEMDDKKVVDVTAGGSEEITFTVKESVAKTFAEKREFDVEFTNGYLSPIEDPNKDQQDQLRAEIEGKFNKDDSDATLEVTDLIKDNDDYVVGFTAMIKSIDPTATGEIEMEFEDLKVYAPLNYSGDIKVKASGRALGYDAETVAINAKKAVEIKTEPMTVKVGLKGQKGGKIEIKETDKDTLKQGEYVYLKVSDAKGDGLKLDTPVVKVTSGDLEIDQDSIDVINDEIVVFKVKRSSDEASTITITDLVVDTNRSVPQGNYKLKLGGRALAEDWTLKGDANKTDDKGKTVLRFDDVFSNKDAKANTVDMNKTLEVKDFLIVGTPNTEDITTANGLRKGTASFVIGSTKYVVNGKEAEMPVAAYTENGRTMIPVRFVANALGINDTEIMYAKGTASVMVGSKTFSFKIGDKVAYINGVPAKTMLTAPVLKNDRCFVPVAELGELLGAEMNWDAATQTATFTVK